MDKYIRFDWAMKRLLRDKANFVVLEGFISSLLEKDVKILRLLESESNQDAADDKQNRVDLLAEDTNGSKFIVEVQNESEYAYFQRVLFGTSKLITEYMKKGRGYDNVQKIYSINIVYFDLGDGDDYIYHGTTEFRGINTNSLLKLSPFQRQKFGSEEVSSLFPEYYILKVNGFNKVAKTPIEEWLDFFKNEKIAACPQAPGLAEAKEIMRYDHMSHDEKRLYDKHLNNIVVLKDNIITARGEGEMEGLAKGRAEGLAEGRAEGLAEGRAEERREIINRMKAAGFDDETIAKIISKQ